MSEADADTDASATAAAATAGTGTGQGNYRGRKPRNINQQNARRPTTASVFKGSVKEMNGNFFNVMERHPTRTSSIEPLKNWMGTSELI